MHMSLVRMNHLVHGQNPLKQGLKHKIKQSIAELKYESTGKIH